MGARGPKSTSEYSGPTAVLSTRITADLRRELEAAAKARGVTLSREIEHRLRRTFLEDRKIEETFGTKRDYAIMRMLGASTEPMTSVKAPGSDWIRDPYLFDQLV